MHLFNPSAGTCKKKCSVICHLDAVVCCVSSVTQRDHFSIVFLSICLFIYTICGSVLLQVTIVRSFCSFCTLAKVAVMKPELFCVYNYYVICFVPQYTQHINYICRGKNKTSPWKLYVLFLLLLFVFGGFFLCDSLLTLYHIPSS